MEKALKDDYTLEYDVFEMLGSGSFSKVYRIQDKKTKEQYALKAIDKKIVEKKMELVETEIKIMSMINHENVVRLFKIYESPSHINLVIEYITGGELFDKIIELKHYDEVHAAEVITQLMKGLQHIHSLGIVHRDLKPENLLLASKDSDNIKLADFGLSALLPGNNEKLQKAVGTPGYIAPEVLLTLDEILDGYLHHVDIWAVGIILYILLSGTAPFWGKDDDETFDLIIDGQFSYPEKHWAGISKEAKDLINHLLIVEPVRRITLENALKHPWLKTTKQTPLPEAQKNIKEYSQLTKKFQNTVSMKLVLDKWFQLGKTRSQKLREAQQEYKN